MLVSIAIAVFKKSRGRMQKIWKLLNRFRGINDLRKRVAHGLWVPFKDGGTVHYVPRNKLSPSYFSDQASSSKESMQMSCVNCALISRTSV